LYKLFQPGVDKFHQHFSPAFFVRKCFYTGFLNLHFGFEIFWAKKYWRKSCSQSVDEIDYIMLNFVTSNFGLKKFRTLSPNPKNCLKVGYRCLFKIYFCSKNYFAQTAFEVFLEESNIFLFRRFHFLHKKQRNYNEKVEKLFQLLSVR